MENFSLSYSRGYKITMGAACSFLAVVSIGCFVRSAKEMLSNSNPDWVLIVVGFMVGLLMLLGAVFAVLWIITKKIELNDGVFRITSLFRIDEHSMAEIISYWRLNEKQPPTIYFRKDGKTYPVTFDIRLDPNGRALELVKEMQIPFNHPVHIKNQNSILIMIAISFFYALYFVFDSVRLYGTVIKPMTPIFIVFIDALLLRSYFLQKKFNDKKASKKNY